MGTIIEINDYLSIELRRDSFALNTGNDAEEDDSQNVVDETPERLELDYRYLFPLKAALEMVEQSLRFQTWLKTKEGR